MSTSIINFAASKSTTVQKGIQAILVKRRLWPPGGVRLVCDTLKCTTCQALSTCGIYFLVRNATPVKKPKIAAENAQNNAFEMNIFFEKKVVNMW